jgi:hypothetical protein
MTSSPSTSGEQDTPNIRFLAANSLSVSVCQTFFPVAASQHVSTPVTPSEISLSPDTTGVARGPCPNMLSKGARGYD